MRVENREQFPVYVCDAGECDAGYAAGLVDRVRLPAERLAHPRGSFNQTRLDAPGDHKGRRQAFHIPFSRGNRSFVKYCRHSPVEGEWAGGHAPVANRGEIFNPPPAVFDQQVHRVRAVRRRLPLGLRLAGCVFAQRLTGGNPLFKPLGVSLGKLA